MHFIPLTKLPSASDTAQLLVTLVVRLHGIPTDIVSDRGPQFTARFWRAFCTLLGTQVSLSSGFHPQSNGQTERANQSLETVLRCLCAQNPASWSAQLPWAEYAINSQMSAATKLTPFECCLGYQGVRPTVSQPGTAGGSLVGCRGVYPAVQADLEGHTRQPAEGSGPDEAAGGQEKEICSHLPGRPARVALHQGHPHPWGHTEACTPVHGGPSSSHGSSAPRPSA